MGQARLPAMEILTMAPIDWSKQTFVYFLGMDDYIKIGQSRLWRQRLSNVQVASPFEVKPLLVIIAAPQLEASLHRKFAKQQARGEWFRDCLEIREYIEKKKPQCVISRRDFCDLRNVRDAAS